MDHIGNHTDKDIPISIINPETGEELCETKLESGDVLNISKTTKGQKEHQLGANFNDSEPFMKLYCKMIPYLVTDLSAAELSFFISICRFIGYDCMLRTTGDKRGSPIDGRKQLATILDISMTLCYKQLSALEEHELIKVQKDGKHRYFFINPFVCFKGKDINIELLVEFSDTKWGQYTVGSSGDR